MPSWFAIRTAARAEKAVRDYLAARDVEVFLPTVTRWSRWKDRRKAIEWPLFEGYCFARFEPTNHLPVLTCPRVSGIVSSSGRLAPIEDQEIENLRILVTSDLQYDPAPHIKEGARVEVVHGPLKGVLGHLVRKGEHARLFLAVDLIAQGVSVEVDAADVRAWG